MSDAVRHQLDGIVVGDESHELGFTYPTQKLLVAAIEAGAQDVAPLTHEDNDDIPTDRTGARFVTLRPDVHAVSTWLSQNGWTVTASEIGYVAKNFPELSEEHRAEVGEFLQSLEEHDDVHRVWAALR